MLSIYSIPPLITVFLFLALGLYVVVKKGKLSKDLTAYSLWCFCTAYWQASWVALFNVHNLHMAELVVKIGYSGIVFLPVAFYHFAVGFLGYKGRKIKLFIAYVIATIFLFLTWFSKLFIFGIYKYKWGFYPKAAELHWVYLLFITILVADALHMLWIELTNQSNPIVRVNQATYVFWATLIYALGCVDFSANYGINIYPFGLVFSSTSLFSVGYAILKHRLMDIDLIIRKTIIYTTVMSTLIAIYLVIVTIFAHIFEGLTGYQNFYSSAVAACLITVGFQPLRKRIQTFIDTKFFRQYVDREEKLYELSREVITHTTPEAMAEALLKVLGDSLHPKSSALYLRSREGNHFQRILQTGAFSFPEVMNEDDPMPEYFSGHSQPFVEDVPSGMADTQDTRDPPRSEDAA